MVFDMLYALVNVDIKTMIIVLCWGNVTSVILVYFYEIFNKNTIDKKLSRYFLAAKLFQGFAFFLLLFRDKIADILSVNMGNTALIIGFYFESVAIFILIHEEKKILKYLTGIISLVSIMVFNILELHYSIPSLRVIIASLCILIVLFIPSLDMLLSKNSNKLKRVIGIYYSTLLLFLLPRAMIFIDYDFDLFSRFLSQQIVFLAAVLLMIFNLPAYLLLMKENTEIFLKHMATTDALTGISNRQNFLDTATIFFNSCKYTQNCIAVLFLDIDHFKNINDTYGHSFGDDVLKRLADAIRQSLRQDDLFCRYGGEEFLVFILSNNLSSTTMVAQRIMDEVRAISFTQYPEFAFTVSIGIALGIPQDQETIANYIDKADSALYEAKNTGRNKIVVR
ncbi:MAG: GGDEF domain-containing protein [Treponema sp.]|jgi:diguanylate cyclase (GGDEF)-like protein|nr:GGDEF domain-containing protein [Treponema sp.]